jgi:hypothetical protein
MALLTDPNLLEGWSTKALIRRRARKPTKQLHPKSAQGSHNVGNKMV